MRPGTRCPSTIVLTFWVAVASIGLSGGAAVRADTAATAPATAAEAPAPAPGVPPIARPAPPRESASLPFRLGLFYAKAFGQSGALAPEPSPAAAGIDLGFGAGSYVRYHLGVGVEWESRGPYAAKGFRFDLVTLGFPIELFADERVHVHVEPLAHIVRGEILFPSGQDNGAIFRVESGFAVAVSAAMAHWFVSLEPLSLDFRSFGATTHVAKTGFSHLWWFQLTAGREF